MKKTLAFLISCSMLLTSCSSQDIISTSENTTIFTEQISESTSGTIISSDAQQSIPIEQNTTNPTQYITVHSSLSSFDTSSEEYINSLGFTSLHDQNLIRYLEDTIYTDLVDQLNSDKYFVENVEAVYISKEYLDELAYNSQENLYFGYKLSELDEAFKEQKYIFTLSDNGQTTVIPFETYDDTFDTVVRNVAVGTGVILLCVTVSVITGGVGATAISMIFATSAKTATACALSSGIISGVSAGVVEGIETNDFDKAIKAAAIKGSEGYMWGAITGAITGGASEASALKGATSNGLSLNQVATIQKESKYPLDVIKQFSSMEQYKICKEAGLATKMINGKTALIRDIDLNFVDEATGMTNLQLMQQGKAAIDPVSKLPYELHHIGQNTDSTLAILTKSEHMQHGNNKIWHILDGKTEVHGQGNSWNAQRKKFWEQLSQLYDFQDNGKLIENFSENINKHNPSRIISETTITALIDKK